MFTIKLLFIFFKCVDFCGFIRKLFINFFYVDFLSFDAHDAIEVIIRIIIMKKNTFAEPEWFYKSTRRKTK